MASHAELRVALLENMYPPSVRVGPPSVEMSRSHSINFISEDFLAGFSQEGRMSAVRRFFCLFVTFDLLFVSLLWFISMMVTGENIWTTLRQQILQYSIYKSMFDVVIASICRFTTLSIFYGCCHSRHWVPIALSTFGSCAFLICKVFYYEWVEDHNTVLQVVVIITSFVLAWGETWFFDCRVLPQERHARACLDAAMNQNNTATNRFESVAPFLSVHPNTAPSESGLNFYSPLESMPNSESEDEQEDEYRNMGFGCVQKAYEILESSDWKMEKVTSQDDTIKSKNVNKIGKVFKLTGRVKYPAKLLLRELFHNVEELPKWNPTLLESRIVRKIDNHTDISYQASAPGPGGVVKSRDFVNLRCWRLYRNGKPVVSDEEDEDNEDDNNQFDTSCGEGSVSTVTDEEINLKVDDTKQEETKLSFSDPEKENDGENKPSTSFLTLSRSLGAKAFRSESFVDSDPPPFEFHDAKSIESKENNTTDKVYVSAAISIQYPAVPQVSKYIRGENIISCWAMRESANKSDACIFEWLLCLDLKGYIPRYVSETAYTTLMQEYMTHLRKHCHELRKKNRKVPASKE